MPLPDWTRAHGAPLFAAIIRSTPADFAVSEELGVEFSGDGEHDLLQIEKTSANSEWVARQLASFAAVPIKDIGYSGLKDRHAVTRQWFSVPRWNSPHWSEIEIEGVELLDVQRHSRKIRRGTHKTNRFQIFLRGEMTGGAELQDRLQAIKSRGVPNYFGEQRFGRGGSNLDLATRWSKGSRLPRQKRSLAISTARSYLFNQILDARVGDGTWDQIVAGDIANLDGSGSVFAVESVDEDIKLRCRLMDIHPTAVLWGDGASVAEVAAGHEHWLDALRQARVKPAQRSLRLPVREFSWQSGTHELRLDFRLGRGSFATAVLREIAAITDAALVQCPVLYGD